MQTLYAFDVDAIISQLGSDYINNTGVNWKSSEIGDELYENFETNLDADFAVDYVGVKCYFKNNEPVAWADDENGIGYK